MRIWHAFSTALVLGSVATFAVTERGNAQAWCDDPDVAKALIEEAIESKQVDRLSVLEQCSQSAVNDLLDAFERNEGRIRSGDLNALEDISGVLEGPLMAVTETMREEGDTFMRLGISQAMQQLTGDINAILPSTLLELGQEGTASSQQAANLLLQMKDIVPHMVSLLNSEGRDRAAKEELVRIGEAVRPGVFNLLADLMRENAGAMRAGASAPYSSPRELCFSANGASSQARAFTPNNVPRDSKLEKILVEQDRSDCFSADDR